MVVWHQRLAGMFYHSVILQLANYRRDACATLGRCFNGFIERDWDKMASAEPVDNSADQF